VQLLVLAITHNGHGSFKVHDRVYTSPPRFTTLSQINPLHALTTCFFNVNTIPPSHLRPDPRVISFLLFSPTKPQVSVLPQNITHVPSTSFSVMWLTASDKQHTNYEAPYYAVLYISLVTPPPLTKVFSSRSCSRTLSTLNVIDQVSDQETRRKITVAYFKYYVFHQMCVWRKTSFKQGYVP